LRKFRQANRQSVIGTSEREDERQQPRKHQAPEQKRRGVKSTRHGPLVPDGMLADVVERLDRIGARVIGLDMFCGQAVGDGWWRLRRLAATNPRLVSVFFDLDGNRAIPGTPPHRQAYADLYTDPRDGVVRRDLLHVTSGPQEGKVSLPMRMLQIRQGPQPPHGHPGAPLGPHGAPDGGSGGLSAGRRGPSCASPCPGSNSRRCEEASC